MCLTLSPRQRLIQRYSHMWGVESCQLFSVFTRWNKCKNTSGQIKICNLRAILHSRDLMSVSKVLLGNCNVKTTPLISILYIYHTSHALPKALDLSIQDLPQNTYAGRSFLVNVATPLLATHAASFPAIGFARTLDLGFLFCLHCVTV